MCVQDNKVECGICYAYRMDGHTPSVVCDNRQCCQSYHNQCLYDVSHVTSCAPAFSGARDTMGVTWCNNYDARCFELLLVRIKSFLFDAVTYLGMGSGVGFGYAKSE